MGAYPLPLVEDRGKRFCVKSNAEDTEYDRLPRSRLVGFRSSRGSSSSRDSLREEDMPDREEEVDVRGPGELEARLANSRESRAWGCKL